MLGSFKLNAVVALIAALTTQTAALPAPVAEKRQGGITTLSQAQVTAFRPYSYYAATGYCTPKATLAWNCGANCQANPQFVPVASGGDGVITQFWYVGFDPTLGEVIVGHQGTDQDKIIPLLTDGDIIFDPLDRTLFPGLPRDIRVHGGFSGSQERSAAGVLAAVKTTLSRFNTTKVTVTGHSLGGAIGLLDAVFLHTNIPGITTKFIGYGIPRVGNQEWADYVDSRPISVTRVNNDEDIVPILPGRFLGYHHTSGEIHISANGAWLSCPGQDNTNARCTIGTVPNIFEGDPDDHSGPYDGITLRC